MGKPMTKTRTATKTKAATQAPEKRSIAIVPVSRGLPAEAAAKLDDYLAATAGDSAAFLKYVKSEWLAGVSQDAIEIGTEMAVDIASIRDGHLKWIKKQPVAEAMRPVIEGPFTPREELGDMDESLWPRDEENRPKDPWSRTMSVLLKDPETWEEFLYATGSRGGIYAIQKLLRAIRTGLHKDETGIPITALETDSYMHHEHGKVHVPALPLRSWKSEKELTTGEDDFDADLDDEVGF